MSNVVDFHPPLSKLEAIPNPDDPGSYLCNIAMTIRLAKDAGTPQGDRFYRTYVAAYHALNGQPLSHKAREEQAFLTTAAKCGWTFRS
jgi:hypothetical protein